MHVYRYRILLFCNKAQRRIMFRCRTLADAHKKYKKLIKEVKPPFPVEVKNRRKVEYFVGMVDMERTNAAPAYTKDSMGRNVTMDIKTSQTLMALAPYWLSEKVYDNQLKEHINFDDLMGQLDAIPGTKMVYKIHSHLFIEAGEELRFYSLKSVSDCLRLINTIITERLAEGIGDCLYARDMNTAHRKYLYEHLNKYGCPRKKFYRMGTR
jgi:hypothetical protein